MPRPRLKMISRLYHPGEHSYFSKVINQSWSGQQGITMFKSILLPGIVLLSSAVLSPSVHAQYGTGYNFHDNLGNTYNNPSSALMGTAINGIMRQQIVSSAVRGSLSSSSSNSASSLSKAPNTVLFTPRTPPLQQWLDNWGQGDLQKRRKAYNEWVAQNAIWKSGIQRHSAKTNDFSQMFALALLIGYEAYTGQPASHAAFVDVTQNVRSVLLDTQKIRTFTNTRKNELVEQQMLSATFALYNRREGQKRGDSAQIAQGRNAAESFLDKWWHGQHNEFVKLVASKGTDNSKIAKAAAKTSQPLSFERAVQLTNFRRIAPTLLPEKLGQSLPEEQHPQEMERVARQLIQQARKQLNGTQGGVSVDNVSLAMTYSLIKLYVIALTPTGNRLGEGVKLPSQAQKDALYRRLTQNLASPDFVRVTDQQKQELSEVFLFTPEFAQQMYNYALDKGNTQMQSQAQEIARTSFERFFGLEPKNFSF
ncbi:hypothetical protein IAD21_02090 [Abditibacteriota bacterium]|nr:hypothetical protein IAD21_02090 [Abditibacteriota bacterium]